MRSRSTEIAKTVFFNLLVFFVIANVFYWSIPVVAAISSLFKKGDPNAEGRIVYKSFVEWQLGPYSSDGVNVEGPLSQRRTVNKNTDGGGKKAYFFGGSTMWGFGVADEMTISSQFAALTGTHSENFAVPAYVAHQGLLRLIQLLQEGHRPSLVVFYDGVNDVWAKCRYEHDANSHMWERDYRSILANGRPDTFSHYFRAVTRLAQRINDEFRQAYGDGVYDCDSKAGKAEAVAGHLIRDWEFAGLLAKSFGAKFLGILQPVAFSGGSSVDRFQRTKHLAPQYRAVYPLAGAKIRSDGDIRDLASIFESNEAAFLDFNHVNAEANGIIARKIAELAAPLGFGPVP